MSRRRQEGEITSLLLAWRRGDDDALASLLPLVYRQLKDIARRLLRRHGGHDTLETSALVHEAYLDLAGLDRLDWRDRAHFFAMSARIMRRVLVDRARRQARAKRGGGEPLVTLDEFRHSGTRGLLTCSRSTAPFASWRVTTPRWRASSSSASSAGSTARRSPMCWRSAARP